MRVGPWLVSNGGLWGDVGVPGDGGGRMERGGLGGIYSRCWMAGCVIVGLLVRQGVGAAARSGVGWGGAMVIWG